MASLPLVLAGPIVRKATVDKVWFWIACSQEVKGLQPSLVPYQQDGSIWTHLVDDVFKEIPLLLGDFRTVRLGENIWIALCSAVPKSGKLPDDILLGYELLIMTGKSDAIKTTKLSELGLDITYVPFKRPTFVIGKLNTQIAHGSCRRPGASGEDAFGVFDEWLAKEAPNAFTRPASLILTGDQIYADDIALPLFEAVHSLAADVFGYKEVVPKADGSGFTKVDNFTWKNSPAPQPGTGAGSKAPVVSETDLWSGRKKITHRVTSPIGFSTEDGDSHLFSLPEFCSMYLAVWNPELCKTYKVDDGTNEDLKDYPRYVKASRRVLANVATYMLCDDHEITDDWNLDKTWDAKTKVSGLARRIISNGLAAYCCFQAWGNDPDTFDDAFMKTLATHFEALRKGKGWPNASAPDYDKLLLERQWSFMAASNPKALCVDTRTRREFKTGKSAILSGKLVWPYMRAPLDASGFSPGDIMLIVLPTPLLPHRSMMYIQSKEYSWPRDAYEGDFEMYGNYAEQRAELMLWLRANYKPSALVIFSGDVHHGSVVTGRYAYGSKLDDINAGKADWVIRVVQITSSPIKNVKKVAYEKKRWWTAWQTDAGNVGESLVSQYEYQYATLSKDSYVAMQAKVRDLKGALGRKTYIFENHLCVVGMPTKPGDSVKSLFVGVKNGKLATANITVDTDNAANKFVVQKTNGITIPPSD
ncbi:MAG: hypothetical protein ABI036_20590 [Fibrobacteria bacterium]